jgi:hypothetical protein
MKIKEVGMNILEKEYQVNEQGMIVEEINEFEIDDFIRSIREIDKEREEVVFNDDGSMLP